MESDMNIPREEAMYISRICWYKFKKVARLALYTPFVVCLASGTLKNDTFLSFLGQDNYYYKAFAKAYEAAEKYTDDDDAKYALRDLQRIATREFKVQDSFLQVRYNVLSLVHC
ncbi:bifunctional TH2 protein, mitochondrial-like [Solanum verrucosum]|uniref:bifunctional TH2 protein, mitochondrial-like n=1 Tax=Solanum verrucosum TaxID=315347 RepID=UPI0020D10017|nr:bifunctional TH2 protein, mitochondrial-like [Solanum verrucosum]